MYCVLRSEVFNTCARKFLLSSVQLRFILKISSYSLVRFVNRNMV